MRRRNMYYMTGLPGWMRFGFSPGWVGRSPTGLGPGASFLTTGQWPTPQAQAYWEASQAGQAPPPAFGFGMPGFAPWGAGGTAPGEEVSMLRAQADWLKSQLDQIATRLAEIEKEQ